MKMYQPPPPGSLELIAMQSGIELQGLISKEEWKKIEQTARSMTWTEQDDFFQEKIKKAKESKNDNS